ncbi:S-methyl-5'-thioinosine phosphorylase [Bermanella marisrubri]|uniref:Purine nucleoside phosphorylase n=1 Tax=Bermanella marisrubri TaxID=207949 RepID=Q1N541_9GAMM|nr:S-methyl-5'-thioinosine phosphorylase [Bermanella marisrubri]EAT13237.1 methylthioadenosine phosphorylase [Oceanobacter sp. RED65] [Bermanella marisrubri]QIZ84005.1 S-methyl-5'-thioinosine phosphorylase [Bermanella marisrubri]
MTLTAIIGGTGLNHIPELEDKLELSVATELGEVNVVKATWQGCPVVFLARHGNPHKIPPHKINYRANLLALEQLNVTQIIAVNAVGGIHEAMGPETICLPDQIIDYTHGREATFFDGEFRALDHIDFSHPYSSAMREKLLMASQIANIDVFSQGVYGATQGPRLETAAEIRSMREDGCDVVGMTGMPEAALARELNIPYASVCLIVNWGAGMTQTPITMNEIKAVLESGMHRVRNLVQTFLSMSLH